MKNKMLGHSFITGQDLYYDGEFEFGEDIYCGETGHTYKIRKNDGWDDYEELIEEELGFLDEEELNG